MARTTILGASLYVPTNHKDLQRIASGEVLGDLRSLIFCTEDSVADGMLGHSLFNLSVALQALQDRPGFQRFVRVRNPEVLLRILSMPGAEKLTGFVLPKTSRLNFDDYFHLVRNTRHLLMPTLETVEVFDDSEMRRFRQCLEGPDVRDRILALRIGGNDLLALLGLRRPRTMTIYRTPLGTLIARLVTLFKPYGFALTAPVFEHLEDFELLAQEIEEDLAHGMVGKTAIHPRQVPLIDRHYRISHRDLQAAMSIINPASPAVFKMHDSMCEVATHGSWARSVVENAHVFGMQQGEDSSAAGHDRSLEQPG